MNFNKASKKVAKQF